MNVELGVALIGVLVAGWTLYWQRRQTLSTETEGIPQIENMDSFAAPDGAETIGAYNLDLEPPVAGPSREDNEAFSAVLRRQKKPVRFRSVPKGSRGTYRGYEMERY